MAVRCVFECFRNSGVAVNSTKFLCDTLPHMSIGARVIRTVALQEIDDAPHAQASAQGHNEGLQGGDSGRKELHINLHILRECYPGHEKSHPWRVAGTLWTR